MPIFQSVYSEYACRAKSLKHHKFLDERKDLSPHTYDTDNLKTVR